MTSLGSQPCRAALLVAILLVLLVLLWVKMEKTQLSNPGPGQRSLQGKTPPAEQGQGQYDKHFMASSVGEKQHLMDKARHEENFTSEAAAIQDHLFDLALCLNLASLMVFL
ncbi:PREDICTED: uncharacterized protein C7orf34 homolog isoform X2 [Chinchilla lanigera]|uniref:uncharacterized protein C7orf34 homolog isoform X2 n=1 Tax=Chinchilla lanigera TaxID=34839 RepID=UPI00038EBA2A|nr:PREDICTED: uncharacterized protein C7orf34 homolog isoform X2 [Chinchilla lanigera]